MRERMDFSSISKMILDNRNNDGMSQTEYYNTLFSYAFEQSDFSINVQEDADISKILKGQRNVPKDITYLYHAPESIQEMEKSVGQILQELSDPEYVKEKIYWLLWNDSSISESKRQELSVHSEADSFITGCLLFALSRRPVSKNKKEVTMFSLADYLLDFRFPSISRVFFGREQEIKEIHDLLRKNHCLFLEGIGGIGKSELAKHYGKRYEKEYSHVLYLRYGNSLKRTIAELDFIDDTMEMTEDERFRNHYRLFKQLDGNSLVILDNFNTVPEDEELFHEFLSLSFKVLVTTRSHVDMMPCCQVNEIRDIEELCSIFYSYAPNAKDDSDTVKAILDEIHHHTLTAELAAKTLQISGMEPKELIKALRTEGLRLSNPNKVIMTKDFRSQKESLYRHIQTLFQLQGLSPESLHTLQNMTLMPEKGIPKILFHYWQGKIDFNDVNDLIEYGWIQEDNFNQRIGLHPYIHELLRIETIPSISSCADLLKGIFENCVCYGIDVSYYNELLNAIESIYKNITLDDAASAYLFMDTTMAYLAKYGRIESVEKVLELMKSTINLDDEHKRESAIYYCYAGYVEYMKSNYDTAKRYYEKGIEALEPFHPVFADMASNLYNNLGQVYFALHDTANFQKYIEKAISLRNEYHLPFSHDALIQRFGYAQALAASGKWREARKSLFAMIRETKKITGMGITLGQMYYFLACIESKHLPEDSLHHLGKAKEAMLSAYLPESNHDIQEIDKLIRRTETIVRGIENGTMHIVPRIDMKK